MMISTSGIEPHRCRCVCKRADLRWGCSRADPAAPTPAAGFHYFGNLPYSLGSHAIMWLIRLLDCPVIPSNTHDNSSIREGAFIILRLGFDYVFKLNCAFLKNSIPKCECVTNLQASIFSKIVMEDVKSVLDYDVIIVGAGISGINFAYRLRENHPHLRFCILEARHEMGGTWSLFKYPGPSINMLR